jgi:hypothetical protein
LKAQKRVQLVRLATSALTQPWVHKLAPILNTHQLLPQCAFLVLLDMSVQQIEELQQLVALAFILLQKMEYVKNVQLAITVLLKLTVQCHVKMDTLRTVYLARLIARRALPTKTALKEVWHQLAQQAHLLQLVPLYA